MQSRTNCDGTDDTLLVAMGALGLDPFLFEEGEVEGWLRRETGLFRTKTVASGDHDMIIKDSGTRADFGTGAVRDAQEGKGRMDLMPVRALIEVSKIMEAGARKYAARTGNMASRSRVSWTVGSVMP